MGIGNWFNKLFGKSTPSVTTIGDIPATQTPIPTPQPQQNLNPQIPQPPQPQASNQVEEKPNPVYPATGPELGSQAGQSQEPFDPLTPNESLTDDQGFSNQSEETVQTSATGAPVNPYEDIP